MKSLVLAISLIISAPSIAMEESSEDKKMHTVFVFSDPPLSEIYVDGEKQEVPTPAVIRVPANSEPMVIIKHDGHEPYTRTLNTRGSGSEINAVLKKNKKN